MGWDHAEDHHVDRSSACRLAGKEAVHLDLDAGKEHGEIDRILERDG